MVEKQVVLIVEDEAVNRLILKKLLSNDYTVLEAENGQLALDVIEKQRDNISAILLDIVMPVMDGYGVMKHLKEQNIKDIPIIVMTGEKDLESEQKALNSGAWDFVAKPYDAKILLTRIGNAVARSKMAMYDEIKYISEHDSLTGLYNREKMFRETKRMITENPDHKYVFIRMDIDHFALYNASFGESEGDQLLCYMADMFRQCVTNFELATYGHMSGDVFCLCASYEGTKQELTKNLSIAQELMDKYSQNYRLKMSTGVYEIQPGEDSIEEFYMRASLGAQKCKHQYGTMVEFYNNKFSERMHEELEIENEMQQALDEEQFVVYLQAKYELSTESSCGAEALVRWNHPKKGLISLGLFIPVFERNGFIAKVDYYVWEKTCALLKEWIDKGMKPYPISVNISRISLYNPQLVNLLTDLIDKYKIPTALLQLEITESAYMTSPEQLESTIHELHMNGFTILMDDFGSGYSSLNTLKSIEVDVLKIDMKFLPTGEEMEKGEIILSSVIRMANWIGMKVVVEGVETRRQRDFIESTGCNCIQGYYYAKPIPHEEYEDKYVKDTSKQEIDIERMTEQSPKHNVTILVIDDMEMGRVLLKEYLQDEYYIHTCESAEEGLAYLQKNKNQVRLILVDNLMPGMTGMEFIRYCNTDMSLQAIPKIMITADDKEEDQVAAFQAGAYDYLTKPLIPEIVVARVHHVMEINQQIHALEKSEEQYFYHADLDEETGLLNKASFQNESMRSMIYSPEKKKALLVIDVDNFMDINKNLGLLKGNAILKMVAETLLTAFRKTDAVGRFGGDEFIVWMVSLTEYEIAKRKAIEVSKRITQRCHDEYGIDITTSIGVAFYEEADNFDTLLARADQALYEAKHTGKAKVVIYGEE